MADNICTTESFEEFFGDWLQFQYLHLWLASSISCCSNSMELLALKHIETVNKDTASLCKEPQRSKHRGQPLIAGLSWSIL